MNKRLSLQNIFGGLMIICLAAGAAFAQSSAFTYQGKLTENGAPATGNYEMRFRLFNQSENGFEFGKPKIISNIAVANGVFTVKIEVGDWTFDQNDRFMEIAVRPQGSANPLTVLAPLQQITLAPKAIFSDTAGVADFSSSSGYAVDALRLNGLDASRYAQKNAGGEIIAPRLENLTADPAPASASNIGRVYFNTTTKNLMVSNGTAWVGVSSPNIQTFAGSSAFTNISCTGAEAIRTVNFTKNSATTRLRIIYKDNALAFINGGGFNLLILGKIDNAPITSPVSFRMNFGGNGESIFNQAFTAFGYANNIAAGSHTLTFVYNASSGATGCFRDSEPFQIEIEEVP